MIVKDVYAYSSLHRAEFSCATLIKTMELEIFCLLFFFNSCWYEKQKKDKLKVKR